MREEILYNQSRTGTTIVYFDTALKPDAADLYPAYLVYDNLGQPSQLTTFDGETKWARYYPGTNFVDADNFPVNTVTGTCFIQTIDYTLSEYRKEQRTLAFKTQMETQFNGLSENCVFFREQEIDDLFVSVKLEQTFKTLDTLSIYNNLRNSFPIQESNTGTVFGRLVAIQKVKDRSGNNIKIPLRNVPIGVFSPSDTFSDATDVDDNGNRITFNIKEGASVDDYFNAESFSADTAILASGSEFETVPEHYKFMTYTNDEGEFVIHNVPVGTQTVVFEVDMFKQGLTKDEISLNFFPFPADPEPNVGNVPSFFFRQFPIDVVPTWGDFQTGYTEVNIVSNLDLRKWSTFFISPVTMDGHDLEFLQSRGISEPIKVQVRDMATQDYPIRNIEVVEIPNIRDRENHQQLMWKNEFKQLKNQVEFRRKGYQAFKVPANIYDPVGFRTDRNGNPTTQKGVWLTAYQFKLFYDAPNSIFRTTGQRKVILDDNTHVRRDHFHLNYPYEEYQNANTETEGAGLGGFPYERPWDHLYPEPYSIPALPSQSNPQYSEGNTDEGNVLENPRNVDGDRIGYPFVPPDFTDDGFGGGTGGYGAAPDLSMSTWYKTDFSRLVTKNTYYKYENRGYILEEYANGYRPNDPSFPVQPGVSSVANGEKYQRTECGYGYFLRPEGWARVAQYPWWGHAEAVFGKDIQLSDLYPNGRQTRLATADESTGGGMLVTVDKINSMWVENEDSGQEISLNMGSTAPAQMREGFLDMYRIVNSNPNENLNELTLGSTITYARFNFSWIRIQNAHTSTQVTKWKLDSDQEHWELADGPSNNFNTINRAQLEIKNKGIRRSKVKVIGGNEFYLNPGQVVLMTLIDLGAPKWNDLKIEVEANAGFNYIERYYTQADYAFQFKNIEFFKRRNGNGANNFRKRNEYHIIDIPLTTNPPGEGIQNYTLQSVSNGIKVRSNALGKFKCDGGHFKTTENIRYMGILWDGYKNKRHSHSFWQANTIGSWSCNDGSVTTYFIKL